MASLDIRIYGDPVLKSKTAEIANVDDTLVRLAHDMLDVMYAAPGVGLAAPQVGVQKRFFVFDTGPGPCTLINPRILEGDGEWVYDEGCLSIPGLYVEIARPKTIHVVGFDLEGNELELEADELLARVIQHELDHLDGITMFDRMDDEQRREALREWRKMQVEGLTPDKPKRRLRLTR